MPRGTRTAERAGEYSGDSQKVSDGRPNAKKGGKRKSLDPTLHDSAKRHSNEIPENKSSQRRFLLKQRGLKGTLR